MPRISFRARTMLVAGLVLLMSLTFTIQSLREDAAANRTRQGAEVTAALASVAASLNIVVKDTAAFLGVLELLIGSTDVSACERGLAAAHVRTAVVGVIRQVFIVRDDRVLCQSSPGSFSVLDDSAQRLRWAVAPKAAVPLASGEPILGAISGEWVVVVARHSVEHRGMVVASISLSTLNDLVFGGLPTTTLITVTDAEGRTLLRSEGFRDRVGHVIPTQATVESISQTRFGLPVMQTREGTLKVTQSEPVLSPDSGGVMRVWAGRDLDPMPWVVFAGRPFDTPKAAEWLVRSAQTLAPVLVLLVVILVLLANLSGELRSLSTYVAQVSQDGNMLPPQRFAPEFAPVVSAFRLAFDMRKMAELELERSNQDLTIRVEERLAELRRSEAFRDAVMETAHDAMLVVDPRGTIVAANSGVEHVLGRTRDQMVGGSLAALVVPPEYRKAHDAAFQRRMSGADDLQGRRVELPVLRGDGSIFPAEIVISSTRVAGQSFSVGFIRDITDRTRTERELREAMTAANAAARAKSQFLATMSHEIRTPLNGIMGMLDLLIDSPADATRAERLSVARRSADALLQLLNDILDYSRLDAGRVELEAVDFDLPLLVAETADLVRDAASLKGLRVTHSVDPDVPRMCRADRARLRQILFNLASNAVKFTTQGEVSLSATVRAAGVRLAVSDTGIGIAADRAEHIFEPFTQADSSMTRRFGGTGLGLAIVKALVDCMGGTVGVTSEPGRGSTFWIDIALDPAPLAEASVQNGRPVAVRPSRILIVEDDPLCQLVARETLERVGHHCDVAPDGPTSLTMVAAGTYDVILMDYRLPGMDGAEATRRLRQRGHAGPIIALTAETSEEDRRTCLDAGMSDFLSKPVNARRLLDTVQSALSEGDHRTRNDHSKSAT